MECVVLMDFCFADGLGPPDMNLFLAEKLLELFPGVRFVLLRRQELKHEYTTARKATVKPEYPKAESSTTKPEFPVTVRVTQSPNTPICSRTFRENPESVRTVWSSHPFDENPRKI